MKVKFLRIASLVLCIFMFCGSLMSCGKFLSLLGMKRIDATSNNPDENGEGNPIDNSIVEGGKYIFESATVEVKPGRFDADDAAISKDQYDALVAQLQTESEAKLREWASNKTMYVKSEGNYVLYKEYLLFENGIVKEFGVYSNDESLEEKDGIKVYPSIDSTSTGYDCATYYENSITANNDDTRISVSGNKVTVEDTRHNDALECDVIYKYYYILEK